jgi:hypothetical protein
MNGSGGKIERNEVGKRAADIQRYEQRQQTFSKTARRRHQSSYRASRHIAVSTIGLQFQLLNRCA